MNAIEEMRQRLQERFRGGRKPLKGYDVSYMPQRVTQNVAPRMPQSQIPSPKPRYSRAGRPTKSEPQKFAKPFKEWM